MHHTAMCRHRREQWERQQRMETVDQEAPVKDITMDELSQLPLGQQEARGVKREREEAESSDHEGEMEVQPGTSTTTGTSEEAVQFVLNVGPPFRDERTDKELDLEATLKGMTRELDSLEHFKVYRPATWEEAKALDGRVYRTRWVLVDKGETGVKARVVVQNINRGAPEDTFAAAPSMTALRVVLWIAIRMGWKLQTADVSTAYLHADLEPGDQVFVVPPATVAVAAGKVGELWHLRKALYGLRRAPRLFQQHLERELGKIGWKRCQADASIYFHTKALAVMCIHADDLLLAAEESVLDALMVSIETIFKLKRGEQITSDKWCKYIGRLWKRTEQGVLVRLPREYLEETVKVMGLEQCRAVATPFPGASEQKGEEQELTEAAHRRYKLVVGKLLWALNERTDIAYVVKECSRAMTRA